MRSLFFQLTGAVVGGDMSPKEFAQKYIEYWMKIRDDEYSGILHFTHEEQYIVDALHSSCEVFTDDQELLTAKLSHYIDGDGLLAEVRAYLAKFPKKC